MTMTARITLEPKSSIGVRKKDNHLIVVSHLSRPRCAARPVIRARAGAALQAQDVNQALPLSSF